MTQSTKGGFLRDDTTGALIVTGPGGSSGIPATLFEAKGDILVATANDTAARKAAGSNGQVLRADSSQADGLIWAGPEGFFDPALQGLKAQSAPLNLWFINNSGGGNNVRPSSGRLIGIKIPVPQTISVSNILMMVSQVGVSLTAGQNKVALVDSAGNKLCETGDQSAAWVGTADPMTMAITGAPIVIPGGPGKFIYAVILAVGATTPGFRAMAGSHTVNNTLTAAAFWAAGLGGLTGQTSIPSSINLANNTSAGDNYFWVGLS